MSLSGPLISVIIPSYNHAKYISQAVESVWNQDYRNIEIVVVDDCSTDGSRDILVKLQANSPIPFKLHFNQSNVGPVSAVRFAISRACGELLVPFASDDAFLPNAFTERVTLFQANNAIKIIFSNGRLLYNDGRIGERLHGDSQIRLLTKEPQWVLQDLYTNSSTLFLQACLIKKELLAACGSYDESLLADDWALVIRMFKQIKGKDEYKFFDKDVFLYRKHGSNLNLDFRRHHRLKLQVIEKYTPEHLKRRAKANIYWETGHSLVGRKPFHALWYLSASQLLLPQLRKIFTTLRVAMAACINRIRRDGSKLRFKACDKQNC